MISRIGYCAPLIAGTIRIGNKLRRLWICAKPDCASRLTTVSTLKPDGNNCRGGYDHEIHDVDSSTEYFPVRYFPVHLSADREMRDRKISRPGGGLHFANTNALNSGEGFLGSK